MSSAGSRGAQLLQAESASSLPATPSTMSSQLTARISSASWPARTGRLLCKIYGIPSLDIGGRSYTVGADPG